MQLSRNTHTVRYQYGQGAQTRMFENLWCDLEHLGMIGLVMWEEEKCRNHFCSLVCAVDDLGFIIFVILVSFVPNLEEGTCHWKLCWTRSIDPNCALMWIVRGSERSLEARKARGKFSVYPCLKCSAHEHEIHFSCDNVNCFLNWCGEWILWLCELCF